MTSQSTEDAERSKSSQSYRKNASSEMSQHFTDDSGAKIAEAANTLFERQAKQSVLKEVRQSPHLRKSFADS